ncbi:MAG: hypothetical protein ACSNEK_01635 [Parachlamydiaceae bacterium]
MMKRHLFFFLIQLLNINGTDASTPNHLLCKLEPTAHPYLASQLQIQNKNQMSSKSWSREQHFSRDPDALDCSWVSDEGLQEDLEKPKVWFRKEHYFSRDPYDPDYYLVGISENNERPFSCSPQLAIYLLDNSQKANKPQLMIDPFLAYRTKLSKRDQVHSFEQSIRASIGFKSFIAFDSPPEGIDECTIRVTNNSDVFCYEKPRFSLSYESEIPEKIWWQISSTPSFDSVSSNLDQISPFSEQIEIDDIAETFLNPNEPYYLRIKSIQSGEASKWSEPFRFFVQKPQRVMNVEFNKIGKKKYELKWQKDPSSSTQYLIFASNSQDFIPSIYSDRHLLFLDHEQLESIENHNLIAITPSNRLVINESFAYYRIIAIDHQQLSVPSDLIYIYDHDLIQLRDRLVRSEQNVNVIERKLFDSSNPYFLIKKAFTDYTTHPYISERTWQKVKPFLIPENHPLIQPLNHIFHKKRVTQNAVTLQRAGFKTLGGGPTSHSQTIFCRHKDLKDYVLKIVPDDYPIDEVEKLRGRIIGAKAVKEAIDKYQFDDLVKVPQKWLYVLPPIPAPALNSYRKNFILIADDMHIHGRETNYAMWKSLLMTPELLKAIYTIITEIGLDDCVYAFNLPFCKDGKIAFLDTEDHHKWPVHYQSLNKYLGSEARTTWLKLTQQH